MNEKFALQRALWRSGGPIPGLEQTRRRVAFCALMLVLTLAVLGPYMNYRPPPATEEGSVLRQIGYLATFAMMLVSRQVWLEPKRLLAVPLGLCLAIAWCGLSLFWAIDPSNAVAGSC